MLNVEYVVEALRLTYIFSQEKIKSNLCILPDHDPVDDYDIAWLNDPCGEEEID